MPLWPTLTWFAQLMRILVDCSSILPRTKQSLISPQQGKEHPMSQKLGVIACLVSGEHTENKLFLNKQPALSCHREEVPQNASIKCIFHNGYSSVINKKLIQFRLLLKML